MDPTLAELQRTVRALAQPLEVQETLFPDFVVLGDELVMELGDALGACRRTGVVWSALQEQGLSELDAFIVSVSGEQYLELWTERDRMRTDPRWTRMRNLAVAVLDAFGWKNVVPSPNTAFYIRAVEATVEVVRYGNLWPGGVTELVTPETGEVIALGTTALDQPWQFVVVNVVRLDTGVSSSHFLLNAFPSQPVLVANVCDIVAARFSDPLTSVIIWDGDGRSHVRSSPKANAEDVALAAAAYQAWGLDEADPMTITVDARMYDVSIALSEPPWRARILTNTSAR